MSTNKAGNEKANLTAAGSLIRNNEDGTIISQNTGNVKGKASDYSRRVMEHFIDVRREELRRRRKERGRV